MYAGLSAGGSIETQLLSRRGFSGPAFAPLCASSCDRCRTARLMPDLVRRLPLERARRRGARASETGVAHHQRPRRLRVRDHRGPCHAAPSRTARGGPAHAARTHGAPQPPMGARPPARPHGRGALGRGAHGRPRARRSTETGRISARGRAAGMALRSRRPGCIAQAWSVAEVLRAWIKTDGQS